MAYATVEELAAALHVKVTTEREPDLQRALDAAAEEIDQDLDRDPSDPLPDPAPAAVVATNISRAVEWYKAPDAAYGIVGVEDTGAIRAPLDGFARHAQNLTRYKSKFGIA